MPDDEVRLAGVELYFTDLARAHHFYTTTLGLPVRRRMPHRYTQLAAEGGFLCLERTGTEAFPSPEKAVVFLEVPRLAAALKRIGPQPLIRQVLSGSRPWAALRDPEGHTVLLVQAPLRKPPRRTQRAPARPTR